MEATKTRIESEGSTQREAAERFNVAQPRISEIRTNRMGLNYAIKASSEKMKSASER